MLRAAERVFARSGYRGATMKDIAREAAISTGNLYRYFENKDALFDTLFTDAFAERFVQLLERRVGSLVTSSDVGALDDEAERDGQELLQFWIDHRPRVIVLLSRAEGTRFEGFSQRFVELLMQPTLRSLRQRSGRRRLPAVVHFTLQTLFQNTVRTIVAILETHESEAELRQAFAAFWSYQLAGLAGLATWVSHDQ